MDDTRANSQRNRSTGSVMSELVHGLQNLVRSEIYLARAELQTTAKETSHNITLAVLFGVLALLGTLPFLAFLVIGLGKLLNDNYWLSSLIIGVICIGVGGAIAARFVKKLTHQNLTLPNTRHSIEGETLMFKNKLHEVSESVQRRAS